MVDAFTIFGSALSTSSSVVAPQFLPLPSTTSSPRTSRQSWSSGRSARSGFGTSTMSSLRGRGRGERGDVAVVNCPFDSRLYLTYFSLILYIMPCYCARLPCSPLRKCNKMNDFQYAFWYCVEIHTPFHKEVHSHSHSHAHSSPYLSTYPTALSKSSMLHFISVLRPFVVRCVGSCPLCHATHATSASPEQEHQAPICR